MSEVNEEIPIEQWLASIAGMYRGSVYMIPTSRGGIMFLPRTSGVFALWEYYKVLSIVTEVLKTNKDIWFARIPNTNPGNAECLALNTNGDFRLNFTEEQKLSFKEKA